MGQNYFKINSVVLKYEGSSFGGFMLTEIRRDLIMPISAEENNESRINRFRYDCFDNFDHQAPVTITLEMTICSSDRDNIIDNIKKNFNFIKQVNPDFSTCSYSFTFESGFVLMSSIPFNFDAIGTYFKAPSCKTLLRKVSI